jgi:ribonuclease R
MALLRSMKQAVYSTDNGGHFALGFEHYTHFTSPIRRYSDLVVHRELRKIVQSAPRDYDEIDQRNLADVADHCSMTERRADDATRDVTQWLKAEFMLDHVGDRFPGTVSAVTNFGIFVEIDEFLIEGLVHITALGRDYFHFDPITHRLIGERTGRRYEIGDKLEVRVVHVDLDETKIDLEPAGSTVERKRRRKTRKKAKS